MKLSFAEDFKSRPVAEALVLPFWEGTRAESAFPSGEFASSYQKPIELGDFRGKQGEILSVYPDRTSKHEKRLILVGLGNKSLASQEGIRRSFASVARWLKSHGITSASFAMPEAGFPVAIAAVESLLLTRYEFTDFKKADPLTASLEKICILGIDEETFEECKKAEVVIEAVNFARDLVNRNADDVTPQELAKTAELLSREFKSLKTTVLGKKELEKEKMGLLLAVGRGAVAEPKLITVEYRGNPKSKEVTALVGKGITYDTGGLNLKMSGMETMKCDMSGAAAVLGTLKACAELKLKVNLVGVIASAENAIGSRSYKVGDVYRSYSGKTVEITNTDAEGRLVLADALAYTNEKFQPTRMIDFATLTGGIVVAIGDEASGLFFNQEALADRLVLAGTKTHERLWKMPLFDEYKEMMKSPIADLKNAGERKASPVQGAIFLAAFVGDTPWAHLDIAGTAYLSSPKHYHTTPATGVGIRLMIEFLSA